MCNDTQSQHTVLGLMSVIRQPLPGFMRCRYQRPHSLSSFPRSCAFSTFARPTDNKPSQRAVILRIFIPLFRRFVRFLPLAVVPPSQVVSCLVIAPSIVPSCILNLLGNVASVPFILSFQTQTDICRTTVCVTMGRIKWSYILLRKTASLSRLSQPNNYLHFLLLLSASPIHSLLTVVPWVL